MAGAFPIFGDRLVVLRAPTRPRNGFLRIGRTVVASAVSVALPLGKPNRLTLGVGLGEGIGFTADTPDMHRPAVALKPWFADDPNQPDRPRPHRPIRTRPVL